MAQSRSLGDLASTLSGNSNTNITFDAGTFYIDSTNNRIGFGTITPTEKVHVEGSIRVSEKIVANCYNETLNSPIISAEELIINCSSGNMFSVNLNSNVATLSFTNIPQENVGYNLNLYLNISGEYSITWPDAVKWPGNNSPILTANTNKTDIFSLNTFDGGNTWFGVITGQNY